MARWFCFSLVMVPWIALAMAKEPEFVPPPSKPLSPKAEQATFKLPTGFTIDLVAQEPDVVDPVAMAFDEDGRLFVAEMIAYPNGGVGTGLITNGRIRLLEDKDGDGIYETSTIWAEGLRLPTSVLPYKGGLLVANAPDLIYLEDSKGTGKADKKRVLYTGFDIANIQQMLSGLQWGLDNWVHGCAGGAGGTITCPDNPKMKPLVLRGRGIRFKPDEPGRIEPTSGGGQYGLTADEFGHWFVATNSQHLRHIILPDHYLARNPNLPVPGVTLDIPEHGAACKVFRISPFESWRVERTKRRKDGPDSKRFPTTELVPGGFVTSGTSPLYYAADQFSREYQGSLFICDPANNLILRDTITPRGGGTYVARRGNPEAEFLASTDNWFRPVWLTLGPDGCIHVADFYREVIETPLSLPEDMKKVLPLKTQDRGRIWRIRPEGKYVAVEPKLGKASARELVRHLDDANVWWRMTAQRLLMERRAAEAQEDLHKMAASAKNPAGRVQALASLDGLGLLKDQEIKAALMDPHPGVREHALKLAESRMEKAEIRQAVIARAADSDPKVRFQLAFTLGAADAPELVTALARVARQDAGDPWAQLAVLSSAGKNAPRLLQSLLQLPEFTRNPSPTQLQLLTRTAQLAGSGPEEDLAAALGLLSREKETGAPWQVAVLLGLGQGLTNTGRSLANLWDHPTAKVREAMTQARGFFTQAGATALDDQRPLPDRLASVGLLGHGPYAVAAKILPNLLTPQQPQDIQLAAVRALALHQRPEVASTLLEPWKGLSPAVRREVLEAIFSRPDRVKGLLRAVADKKVIAGQLEPSRLEQLRKHPDSAIRAQALKLLAGQATPDRQKIVAAHENALDLPRDVAKGKALFKKVCATCHRLENVGVEVGADLQSALPNKTPDRLLVDILDPSREVDPRYLQYMVTTLDGKVVTGLIAAETSASITLRRAEKIEDTILRGQIDTIQSTTQSLMPDGFENQLSRQDLADLIGYLQSFTKKKQ